jgi:hypothetical protein
LHGHHASVTGPLWAQPCGHSWQGIPSCRSLHDGSKVANAKIRPQYPNSVRPLATLHLRHALDIL